MIKEMNHLRSTDFSKKIKKECTNGRMEKLKAAKDLTQKKVEDFGATFGVQERVAIKMLNS